MAVVKLEIKTRQPLADGRKFDHVGCYEQLEDTAHFAVDPAHRLNCAVTDIDLAERGRDGLVHFTADVRILAPADQGRGNHRLLFDVPNRGNRLALATFNGVPRPINPAGPTDAGNGLSQDLFGSTRGRSSGRGRAAARRAGSLGTHPALKSQPRGRRRRALIRTWPEQKPVNAAGSQRNFETCA